MRIYILSFIKWKLVVCFVIGLIICFYYPASFAQNPKLILPVGHTSMITSANFSADGKYIVTASLDLTAKIWNGSDGKLLNELKGHTASLLSAVFSPDGKYIVTASKDKTTKIWQTSDGQLIRELKGHTDWVTSALFSPDGKYIVTASWDNTAKIWEASTGQIVYTLTGHKGALNSASFSPDGKYIVTASNDSTAKIWQASTGKILSELKGHSNNVISASFSPDGKYIVTASWDNTAKIWQTENGKLLTVLKGHTKALNSAMFSPDGKYIVTSSLDSTAKIWLASNGNRIHEMRTHKDAINAAMFSPDGKYIVTISKDNTGKIWNASSGSFIADLKGHTNVVSAVSFSSDSKQIVTGSWDNTAMLWNAADGKLIDILRGHTSVVSSAIFSPDGKYIAAALWDNTAKIWDAYTGQLLTYLKGHTNWVNTVAFSEDSKYIVTASMDNTARIWRVSTGHFLRALKGHTDNVNSAIFSPDGKYIATASWDNTAKIWETASGKLIHNLRGHTGVVKSALFSPDGKYIVTASWDNTAKIWEAASGKLIHNLKGHTDKVRTAIFSPDGKYILTASWDSTAKIWEPEDGQLLRTLKGHTASLNSAAFSPDGKYIVTGSLDNTAKIWQTDNGKLLADLKAHNSSVNSVSFSPDGKYIITASEDNTAKVWLAAEGKLQSDLKEHTAPLKSAVFSPDGNYLVTTSEDNTLKKWKTFTGEFLYTFFAIDSTDYLVLDKDGHYDGTEKARKMLYYVCENEIVDLEQFKDLSWEPDLVSKLMGVNKEPVTAKKISEINICNYTPEVVEQGFSNGIYHYQITPKRGGLGEVQLYVNGKLIEKFSPSSLVQKNNIYILKVDEKIVKDYLIAGTDNKILVKATTLAGTMLSRGASLKVTKEKSGSNPDMYIVSVGISKYKGDKLKLSYASKDAVDFGQLITSSAQKLLNTDGRQHIFTYTFNTEAGSPLWPSKTIIEKRMDSIAQKAKADDIIVIFLAGHGVLPSGQKNFYLLTAEATDIELSDIEKEVAISTDELKEWLRKIKANKQILILDACYSGQAIKNLQELIVTRNVPADQQRALESLKDKTGMFILSASTSSQSAYETSLYAQGLLTYSLLSGIKLGGGLRDNKFIDVNRWFNYAANNVKILAKDIGGRQDPQIIGNASFEVGLVDKEIIDNIKLTFKKKIFSSSKLIMDAELLNDDLNLSSLIDIELNNLSGKGKESPLVFAADNTLTDAYSIRGRYAVIENKLSAKVFLVKGTKEKIYQFELSSTEDKKDELARKIVERVQHFLNQ